MTAIMCRVSIHIPEQMNVWARRTRFRNVDPLIHTFYSEGQNTTSWAGQKRGRLGVCDSQFQSLNAHIYLKFFVFYIFFIKATKTTNIIC
jgi:hypothetical protein